MVFIMCSKSNNDGPPGSFDPTRYYIAGTRVVGYKTNYAILLNADKASALLIVGGSLTGNSTYLYSNNHLKITDAIYGNADLTITNDAISDYATLPAESNGLSPMVVGLCRTREIKQRGEHDA